MVRQKFVVGTAFGTGQITWDLYFAPSRRGHPPRAVHLTASERFSVLLNGAHASPGRERTPTHFHVNTMKDYSAPQLVEFGKVGDVTGIFGSEMVEDQSFGPQGRVIATGTGSINQCATNKPRGACI